jgi:MYXO-CTERM domain-containing protein
VVRLSPHEFLVANYSSAFRHEDRSWLWGQLNGTGIYFVRLRFEPLGAATLVAASGDASRFDEDWPTRESYSTRLAGAGALSVVALVLVRRRRRRLIA